MFSLVKRLTLKYIGTESYFTKQASAFLDKNATEVNIIKAGEAALLFLYKSIAGELLLQ